MKIKQVTHYSTPALLGVLIFASNFMGTNLFRFGEHSFSVWFVLSVFCFACGWFINKSLGWHFGGKIVFAVTIAVTFISVILISVFRNYFSADQLLAENLILYSLRNITLGAMAFFGMAVAEIIILQKEILLLSEKIKMIEGSVFDSKKEAELELKEARLKAKKILNDAEAEAKNTILRKERIERELKEFILAEKELIKKYEEDNG